MQGVWSLVLLACGLLAAAQAKSVTHRSKHVNKDLIDILKEILDDDVDNFQRRKGNRVPNEIGDKVGAGSGGGGRGRAGGNCPAGTTTPPVGSNSLSYDGSSSHPRWCINAGVGQKVAIKFRRIDMTSLQQYLKFTGIVGVPEDKRVFGSLFNLYLESTGSLVTITYHDSSRKRHNQRQQQEYLFTGGYQTYSDGSPNPLLPQTTVSTSGCTGYHIDPTNPGGSSRIIGGGPATSGTWDFLVSLASGKEHEGQFVSDNCGGSILSPYWVVTAAHCTNLTEILYVTAGEWEKSETEGTEQTSVVIEIIRYNHTSYYQDIALLRLATPLTYTDAVNCIGLATQEVTSDAKCWIMGWGVISTQPEQETAILQQVKLPFISTERCWEAPYFLDDCQVWEECGGRPSGGIDTCFGDSGGPYACYLDNKWQLAGLVSRSTDPNCGQPNKPSIFTRPSYFQNWIRNKTQGQFTLF